MLIIQTLQDLSIVDYNSHTEGYKNAFSKALSNSMVGVSEHDIYDMTIVEYSMDSLTITTNTTSNNNSIQNTVTNTNAAANVYNTQNVQNNNKTVYIQWYDTNTKPREHIQNSENKQNIQQSIKYAHTFATLQCTINIQNSIHTYTELSAQLQTAKTNDNMDNTLHMYAVYLALPLLTNTTVFSMHTTQSSDSSSNSSSSKKNMVVVLVVLFSAMFLFILAYILDLRDKERKRK